MRPPDATARTVLAAFAAEGPRARWHTTVRWWTCPFPLVADLVPEGGRVLDLGCGHGLFSMYLALGSPSRSVVGVDIDGAKVEVGSRAVARAGLSGRVELRHVPPGWLPDPGTFDAVVTNDVLYLMGRARAQEVLSGMAAALRPGGTVLVKEMASSPRWKHRVNAAQERLAVGVLGLTAGSALEVLPASDIEAPLRAAGLRVAHRRLDRGYPHPHLVVIGAAV